MIVRSTELLCALAGDRMFGKAAALGGPAT